MFFFLQFPIAIYEMRRFFEIQPYQWNETFEIGWSVNDQHCFESNVTVESRGKHVNTVLSLVCFSVASPNTDDVWLTTTDTQSSEQNPLSRWFQIM